MSKCVLYIEGEKEAHMKRKLTALVLALMVCVCGFWNGNTEVHAEEIGEDIDFSYLLTDEALIGYAESQTWGYYLSEGYSIINKAATNKIGAGGITNATRLCKVGITSIVERQTTTGWARVTSWTNTVASGYSAMISKSLIVGTGYNYRVRSTHYAGTDGSSSWTGALKM